MSNIAPRSDDAPCLECNDVLFPGNPTSCRQIQQQFAPDSGCISCTLLQNLPPQAKSPWPGSSEAPCSLCHDLLLPDAQRFRHTFNEVRESAEKCLSCELLQKLAEQAEPDESIREDNIVTLRIKSEALYDSAQKFLIILENKQGVEGKCLEVYSHEPTQWYNIPIVPPEPIPRNIIDPFEQATSWIDECTKNHPLCILRDFSDLPNRILHLQGNIDNLKVRLHVSNGEKAPYVALSHRWGEENTPTWRTLITNIDQHLQEIPLANLSRLFLQAILYTLLVGMEYIWIDSLCIVQDDESDWEREASNMGSVYTNAYITLAATGSRSSGSNLWPALETKQLAVQLRAPENGQAGTTMFAREAVEHISKRPERQADRFPLLKRAWVYQERLLSRRILHFGPGELFWECLESMKCECSYLDASTNMKNVLDPRFELNVKRKHFLALCLGNAAEFVASNYPQAMAKELIPAAPRFSHQPHALEVRWREIVTEYSGLALTFSKDRLTALSGLAKQMRRYRGSRYLAGLWEDSLFRDLVWVSSPLDPAPKRQPVWQAPSWSWASQVGAIRYTGAKMLSQSSFCLHLAGGIWGNPGNVSSPLEGLSCELVEANCTPTGTDDTGMLSSGFIKVSGYVIDGIDPRSSITTTDHGFKRLAINENSSFEFHLDEQFEQFEEDEENGDCLSQSFCLLRIGCIPLLFSSGFLEWSLLLQRVEHNDTTFRRRGIVGVLTEKSPACHDSIWYGKVREKTIVTIV